MTESREGADKTVPLTHNITKGLLRCAQQSVFITAEDDRSWSRKWTEIHRTRVPGSVIDQLWNSVLLRTFDANSGSPPDAQGRLSARDARMRLDTVDVRRDTLTAHANHANWNATPYISFTNSPIALRDLAERRRVLRGNQSVVVVDPRVRFDLGLPVLHYKDEMAHYNIKSPYARDYWGGHYLCLWEVTPEEVVGVWKWNDLRSKYDWFEAVIMPMVEAQRKNREACEAEVQSSSSEEDGDGDGVDGGVGSDDDTEGNEYWSESDDSDERVLNENWTGQLMKTFEDLRLD